MKQKYIKIDAKNIYKEYGEDNKIKEDNQIVFDIFEKYQIPSYYRAIILRQNKNHFFEIITNREFIPDIIANNDENKNIILGNFPNDVLTFVKGTFEDYNGKNVIEFMKGITKEGFSKEYIQAVKEIMTNKLTPHKSIFIKKKILPKNEK